MNNKNDDLSLCGLSQDQLDAHWMPFTGNRDFKQDPRMIVSAEGNYYTAADGRKIFDGERGDLRTPESLDLCRRQRFGLRSGPGGWPGLNSALLATETLTPLCSPALREALPASCTPPDLLRHRLLHDTPKGNWGRWFSAAGYPDLPVPAGLNLTDSAIALQAAADGQGVALGRLFLAAADLRAGRLVMPCPEQRISNDYAYWLVWPPRHDANPAITAVRDWIRSTAQSENTGAEQA